MAMSSKYFLSISWFWFLTVSSFSLSMAISCNRSFSFSFWLQRSLVRIASCNILSLCSREHGFWVSFCSSVMWGGYVHFHQASLALSLMSCKCSSSTSPIRMYFPLRSAASEKWSTCFCGRLAEKLSESPGDFASSSPNPNADILTFFFSFPIAGFVAFSLASTLKALSSDVDR